MKIKKTFLWVFIILFFLVLPSWIFFVSNLAFWPGNNYIFAHSLNKYLAKIFPENEKIQLKKGDYYYRFWEYKKALEQYTKIDCKTDLICSILYYNLGNTYYRLWENTPQITDKLWFWQQALSVYQKALQILEDEKTRKNYEFVLKKMNEFIDEMKKKQELEKQPPQQEPSQENQDTQENDSPQPNTEELQDENNNTWEEKSQSPQPNTSDNQIQPRWPSMKIDENALDTVPELTQEQKEEIQKYIEKLQQEEKNNIHLNKPREQKDIFDILRDDFMFEWMKQNQSGW